MFGRSNLKIRILFGYSLPILCLVGLGAIVYSSAKDTFERQAAIRTSQITINGINEMTFGLGTMVRNARGYILFPEDKTSLQSYKSGIEFFRGGYTEIDQKVDNSQIREQLALYLTDYNQKKQAAEEIFRLVDGGKIPEAKRLLRSVNMIEAEARRKNIIEQQVVILAQKDKEGADAQRLLIQLVFGGTALSTLFIIIVGVWVSNAIAAPLGAQINQLVKTAEQISVGDLTAPVIISAQDSQEIKKLLAAFQAMSCNLNSLIVKVQQSGIQVTTSATEISASSKQVEAAMTEQAASTNQVVATIREITALSENLARVTETIEIKAQSTAAIASEGQKDLGQMEFTMQQLAQGTDSMSARLGTISEKVNNINAVILTINKVADQTNLLSLNAAIEAEKAGEYGLGFAVVAREIRRLADQTAIATIDIEQIVKEMQSAVSTGVTEMDKFTHDVSHSVANVRSVGSRMTQVIGQVQDLTPQLEMLAQGMNTQSEGAQQINEAMIQLSETSSHTLSSLQEANGAVEQLYGAAQGLHQEVSGFKVASR